MEMLMPPIPASTARRTRSAVKPRPPVVMPHNMPASLMALAMMSQSSRR